jgi:hypothetical protein
MTKQWNKCDKPFCPKCGYLEVEVLSTGEILCKNPHCLTITPIEREKEVEKDE